MTVALYRKRPTRVETYRWTGEPDSLPAAWLARPDIRVRSNGQLAIETLEGTMRASVGDWIVQGVHNELHPVKPDIFAKTYDLDEGTPVADPYSVRILEAIDQLGNALSGGSPHHTVSARTGYWSHEGNPSRGWRTAEALIDAAMYPWQGFRDHCVRACRNERARAPGYDFRGGSGLALRAILGIVVVACPVMFALGWLTRPFRRMRA